MDIASANEDDIEHIKLISHPLQLRLYRASQYRNAVTKAARRPQTNTSRCNVHYSELKPNIIGTQNELLIGLPSLRLARRHGDT